MNIRRQFTDSNLFIASHNKGKLREIEELLKNIHPPIKLFSLNDFAYTPPVEDGDTFTANAIIKAKYGAKISNMPTLADDSGLCVRALNDAPGIYSARWARPEQPPSNPDDNIADDFTLAMWRVHEALRKEQAMNPARNIAPDDIDMSAYFICVLALAWPDGHAEVFEGRVNGHISWEIRGDNGFGYDPIFIAEGHNVTFGELDPDKKQTISHRMQAFNKMVNQIFAKNI